MRRYEKFPEDPVINIRIFVLRLSCVIYLIVQLFKKEGGRNEIQ